MTQATILLSPIKSAIAAQGGALEVLIRPQAPDQPAGTKATVTPSRDLLAASLQAHTLDGQTNTVRATLLSLPVVDAAVFASQSPDQALQDRLLEVEFAQASQDLRVLVQKGDIQMARKVLKDLEQRFGQHPWLQDKLNHLRELAERDPEMMSKEVRFSAMRMSSRLSAKSEVRYSVDETDLVIPAFLRKKGQEGRWHPAGHQSAQHPGLTGTHHAVTQGDGRERLHRANKASFIDAMRPVESVLSNIICNTFRSKVKIYVQVTMGSSDE